MNSPSTLIFMYASNHMFFCVGRRFPKKFNSSKE